MSNQMSVKTDMLIIHKGTNDQEQDLNTKNDKKLVNVIKEIDKENYIEIPFSGIVYREDRVCKNVIDDTSNKLRSYCASVGRGFINNDTIDGSCQIEANYT